MVQHERWCQDGTGQRAVFGVPLVSMMVSGDTLPLQDWSARNLAITNIKKLESRTFFCALPTDGGLVARASTEPAMAETTIDISYHKSGVARGGREEDSRL